MFCMITPNYMGDPMAAEYNPRGPWFWIVLCAVLVLAVSIGTIGLQ